MDDKEVLSDGRVIQRIVWQLPEPTPERPHGLKYRLYCGKEGRCIVRYDNETGKGDHVHYGEENERSYGFISFASSAEFVGTDLRRIYASDSFKQLFSAITEKRMELIRFVAAREGLNTRQLAQALGRDYKNVYKDVRELCSYGLLEKDEKGGVNAPYDEIVIRAGLRDTQAA
ncbi:MAG: toxin-antitoxin system TumE family protein [Gammaproteobacteria bacterium]